MTEQPNALRLADALMEKVVLDKHMMQAAAELRRLHEENFSLAAHQCLYHDGSGLTGDDGGTPICRKDKRIQVLEDQLGDAMWGYGEAKREIQEQARIIGMGAERELRLMAEKQELLEALKLYVTQDSFATDYGYGVGGEAKATAEAAIAKAEGGMK